MTEIAGSAGRITLHRPAHSPTRMSVRQAAEDQVPSLYATANVPLPEQVFEYPLPGTFSMQRPHPNQHGFLYQAEAVHRCLAAGLRECPQYGQQESLHAMDLLTVGGLGFASFAVLQTSVVLQGTDPALRGRALGAVTLGIGSQPFGALALGGLAEVAGAPLAVAGMSGVGLVLVLAVSLALRVWRPPRPDGAAIN